MGGDLSLCNFLGLTLRGGRGVRPHEFAWRDCITHTPMYFVVGVCKKTEAPSDRSQDASTGDWFAFKTLFSTKLSTTENPILLVGVCVWVGGGWARRLDAPDLVLSFASLVADSGSVSAGRIMSVSGVAGCASSPAT